MRHFKKPAGTYPTRSNKDRAYHGTYHHPIKPKPQPHRPVKMGDLMETMTDDQKDQAHVTQEAASVEAQQERQREGGQTKGDGSRNCQNPPTIFATLEKGTH
jgi:hypothetical protein